MPTVIRRITLITINFALLFTSACIFNVGIKPISDGPGAEPLFEFGVNDLLVLPLAIHETWDQGIDRVQWKPWGGPGPTRPADLGRENTAALNPNGDATYYSGLTSRFLLTLKEGAAIEFWAKGHATEDAQQSLVIGISQTTSESYSGIESQPLNVAEIYLFAEFQFNNVDYNRQEGDRLTEPFAPLDDSWHLYRIQINPSGTISYYRDGEHKYTTKNAIDFDVYQHQAITIAGKSVNTQMLIDDVKIYGQVIPAPELTFESLSPLFSQGHVVSTGLEPARFVGLADLDGDGDQDIVATRNGNGRNQILGWENPGSLSEFPWDAHIIGKNNTAMIQLTFSDFDLDGDIDVASGANQGANYEVMLWENDGTPFDGLWASTGIGKNAYVISAIAAGDFDADGDVDLVTGAAGESDVEIRLWENNGLPSAEIWSSYDLGATDDSVFDLEIADFDQDGDLDVASGGRRDEDYEIIVWENNGAPFSGTWQPNDIGTSEGDVVTILATDIDQDGWIDLVSGSDFREDYEIIAWRNSGNPFSDLWFKSDLGSTDKHANTLVGTDLNLDGYLDIFSGSGLRDENPELLLWLGNANPFSGVWDLQEMGDLGETVPGAVAADMDGDGDQDIVVASASMIIIWENQALP
jgi:hypothetical protein